MLLKGTAARMIAFVIIFFLSGFIRSASAQDILTLRSGRELKVNIVEETTFVIKYREAENPTGPLYSVEKSKVESVKYSKKNRDTQEVTSGRTEKAEKSEAAIQPESDLLTVKKRYVYKNGRIMGIRQVKTTMEETPEALNLYNSGSRKCKLSNSCAYGVIFTSMGTTLATNKMEPDEATKFAIVGLAVCGGFIISGIVLASKGKKQIRQSVQMYNSTVIKPASYQIDFRVSPVSAGISVRF